MLENSNICTSYTRLAVSARFQLLGYLHLLLLPFCLVSCADRQIPQNNSNAREEVQSIVLFRRNSSVGTVGEVFKLNGNGDSSSIWLDSFTSADIATDSNGETVAALSDDRKQIKIFSWDRQQGRLHSVRTIVIGTGCDLVSISSMAKSVCWLKKEVGGSNILSLENGKQTIKYKLAGSIFHISISPDGRSIAYSKSSRREFHPGVFELDLWLLDLDSKIERYIGQGGFTSWNSDGTMIATVAGTPTNGNAIVTYLIKKNESKILSKVNIGNYITLSWFPNSNNIAVYGIFAPESDLVPSLFSIDSITSAMNEIAKVPFSVDTDYNPNIWIVKK